MERAEEFSIIRGGRKIGLCLGWFGVVLRLIYIFVEGLEDKKRLVFFLTELAFFNLDEI